MFLAPIRSPHEGMYLAPIRASFLFFGLRHAVKIVDSCTRENGVLHTVARSWLLFLPDKSEWKNFKSNITRDVDELHQHFDLSSPFTARCPSCVARFMICWVCRLYFSGLVSSALSLDECLIKINYGRFCVAPRKLCRLVWHRVWLRCNIKRCFYRTTIFLRKIAEFSCVSWVFLVVWLQSIVRSLNGCKCVARWILCHYWLLREIVRLFREHWTNGNVFDAWREWSCGVVYVWPCLFDSVIWNEWFTAVN